ncbi:MAG TPA: TIGR03790 family protein [Chthoniobacterales bacterium]|nr:TIGR03790 family protein [Chthoniobacterales bacterium]
MRLLWFGLAICAVTMSALAEKPLAPATIVVFNQDVPESVELARFYAQKRGIAREHLVGLSISRTEEISREEYDAMIRNPLRAIFKERGWWTLNEPRGAQVTVTSNAIRFVALIKGVPLKIRPVVDYPGDKPGGPPIANRNDASVDSEVAALGAFSDQISGPLQNPYFQSYRAMTEAESSAMLLVCRLDAPQVATVRRMITDAIETEKTGLWGRAYLDAARNSAPGFATGDHWLADARDELHKDGVPLIYEDTPEIFPNGYPMTDCALYYGWYTDRIAGPFTQPDFQFVPGAIAVHIHSFSASTLHDENSGWAGPLLTKGAAATIGNVYEPYLQLTAHLDILNDRLLHGFTFAESAYMASPVLSWMSVMVGDPLYRPYAGWLGLDGKGAGEKSSSDWSAYHSFAVKNASLGAAEYRAAATAFATRTRNAPMLEDIGLLDAGAENYVGASGCFDLARTIYSKRDDILRTVLHEADALTKQNKAKRALDLVRTVLRIAPDAPAASLLKKAEMELRATKPSPPKSSRPNE